MKVRTRLWTTMAAAGLMALPLSAAAQSSTTSSTQSGQSGTPTTQSGQQPTQTYGQSSSSSSKSPVYYLEQAGKDLDSLSSSFKSTDAGQDLERHFRELRMAYERDARTPSEGAAPMSGTSGTSGSSSIAGSNVPASSTMDPGRTVGTGDTWRTHYRQIEDTLDSLSVPRSSAWMPIRDASGATSGSEGSSTGTSGSGTGSSGTTGTSGSGSTTSGSSSGSSASSSSASAPSPDAGDLAQLNQFRQDIETFYQSIASSGNSTDRDSVGSQAVW